jgi:hypothetical protein
VPASGQASKPPGFAFGDLLQRTGVHLPQFQRPAASPVATLSGAATDTRHSSAPATAHNALDALSAQQSGSLQQQAVNAAHAYQDRSSGALWQQAANAENATHAGYAYEERSSGASVHAMPSLDAWHAQRSSDGAASVQQGLRQPAVESEPRAQPPAAVAKPRRAPLQYDLAQIDEMQRSGQLTRVLKRDAS